MFDAPVLRRSVIMAAPLLMIAFSLVHGLDWVIMHGMHDDYEAFLEYIVQIRARWLAVHVAGLVLFPLLGVAIWWMLPPDGWATRVSQVGIAGYIVLYSAFDAIAGIGSAVLADYRQGLPEEQRGVVDGAIWALMGESDPTFYLAESASYAWLIGTIAAAVALWRNYGWRVSVPLVLGAAVFFESHFPPFGAIAGGLLAVAAWQFLRRARQLA